MMTRIKNYPTKNIFRHRKQGVRNHDQGYHFNPANSYKKGNFRYGENYNETLTNQVNRIANGVEKERGMDKFPMRIDAFYENDPSSHASWYSTEKRNLDNAFEPESLEIRLDPRFKDSKLTKFRREAIEHELREMNQAVLKSKQVDEAHRIAESKEELVYGKQIGGFDDIEEIIEERVNGGNFDKENLTFEEFKRDPSGARTSLVRIDERDSIIMDIKEVPRGFGLFLKPVGGRKITRINVNEDDIRILYNEQVSKIKTGMSDSTSKHIFDLSTTGMGYYDGLLQNPEYYRRAKGKEGKIVWMSPDEYMRRIAKYHKVPVQTEYEMITNTLVNHYAIEMIGLRGKEGKGRKFPMLVIEKNLQEGRHRAMACKKIGIDKVPVLIVTEVSS